MVKKYIVRLSDEERTLLRDIVKKLKGTSQKVRRANTLLKADVDGPNWSDAKIAEAFSCRTRTIENVRRRLVTEGLDAVLNRKKRETPPTPKLLDGKQEAEIIAMRLGKPPAGLPTGHCDCWLTRSSHWKSPTRSAMKRFAVRLKKRDDEAEDSILGHPAESQRRVCRLHGGCAGNLCPAV